LWGPLRPLVRDSACSAGRLHNDYDRVEDSALFVLDLPGLNKLSGISEVKSIPDDPTFDYRAIYWDKKPF
jgi:hypothetical protein